MPNQESFNPVKHEMEGAGLRKVIRDEENLPFEVKLKNAKEKIDDILNRENSRKIVKIAEDLLNRHPIASLERMTEAALDREAGEYCTGMELLAVCDYLHEKSN